MSRRQDREGVHRSAYQAHKNAKLAACYAENARGWRIPNTVEDAFEAFGMLQWWTHYRLLWFATGVLTPSSGAEVDMCWRYVRGYLRDFQACPGPRLP